MIFTRSLPKPKGRGFSKTGEIAGEKAITQDVEKNLPERVRVNTNKRTLPFDLFAQLSYMSAIATTGVTRSHLFEVSADLPYVSSGYFKNIHLVAKKLNIDYAQACRLEAERTKEPEVKSLLLRTSGALASGESEAEFFSREAHVIGELYTNQYSRDVESLKRWTDAYSALVVSAALIVIVAVISMMIYEVGTIFVIGLAVGMIGVSCVGAWIIYASAPREILTRTAGLSAPRQKFADQLFKILGPIAVAVCSLMVLKGFALGWVFFVGGLIIFPVGYIMNKDDKRLNKIDADLHTVVRVLGQVTSATGTTVSDVLWKIDKRSMGNLEPYITKLRNRFRAGIKTEICWKAMVDECGSELIDRTVKMFEDSIKLGGDPDEVGAAAAFYASRISILRAGRALVASSFIWLTYPLQIALVAILEFIVAIMGLFAVGVAEGMAAMEAGSDTLSSRGMAMGDLFAFGHINLELVGVLVTSVVIVITVANSFAAKAASGGHGLKFLYFLSINMMFGGLLMVLVPSFANSMFSSIMYSHPY